MKSYLYTAALVAALFVSAGLASSTASAPADARNVRESELVVSFDEAFTGDSTIDGETTLAGAYNDKGSRHQDFTVRQSGNIVQVSGTITITTSHGTLISEFAGQLSATNNPTFIEGVETLTGGPGFTRTRSGAVSSKRVSTSRLGRSWASPSSLSVLLSHDSSFLPTGDPRR